MNSQLEPFLALVTFNTSGPTKSYVQHFVPIQLKIWEGKLKKEKRKKKTTYEKNEKLKKGWGFLP